MASLPLPPDMLREGHGAGRGTPHIEIALKDVPQGVPASEPANARATESCTDANATPATRCKYGHPLREGADVANGAPARCKYGHLVSSEGTRAQASKGGLALRDKRAREARELAEAQAAGRVLGLGRLLNMVEDERLAPFIQVGIGWLDAQSVSVAARVGGGSISPGVCSILQMAAWQFIYSNFYFDLSSSSPASKPRS
jgi:hypothetical protein